MIEIIIILNIAAAVTALESRNNFSAVISLGILGSGLALIMLFLRSPDAALVQMPVTVLLMIMLMKTAAGSGFSAKEGKKELFIKVSGIVILAVILAGLISGLAYFPGSGSSVNLPEGFDFPSSHYTAGGFRDTVRVNKVNEVLMRYRAFDAMAAVVLLFSAAAGMLAVFGKTGRDEE